jgi:L,D-transpeptidase YcbB
MRCGPRAVGLVWLLASLFSGASFLGIARAEEAAATAKSIPEPELPPELDQTPPKIAVPPPPTQAAKAEAIAGVEAGLPETSDPEVGAPTLAPGATPDDIEDALEALPPAEGRHGVLAAPPNWRATREALIAFYAGRAHMAIWTDAAGFNSAGRAVIARLRRADEDGLDLSGLAIPDPKAAVKDRSLLAKAEVGLAETILAYAFQASGGRIDPARISPMITAKAAVIDPIRALSTVASAKDPDAALAAFNPPQKGYRDLREKLARLRASLSEKRSGADSVETTAPQGGQDSRRLIRAQFDPFGANAKIRRAGPRTQIAAADSPQPADEADAGEFTALSPQSPPTRALQASVLANMEMWRWEPRDMGEERIEINVADFSLRVLRGEETLLSARIIVGKPDTQTPIFSNAMRYILVNPSWRVPQSIIRKEMLPKLADDPDYLTRQGFEVTQRGDTIEVLQPPGERNALGHIAFMFPNEHSVYLHDTPSRELFMAARRAFSHGCVRVDQPMRLAQLVMGANWSEQRLRSLIGGAEHTIFLPRPVPIHIEYFTAFVDDAGAFQTRDDLYGHVQRVESALGLGRRN